MSGNGISLDNINIIGPEHYRINGYPHPEWAYLREHKPVFWCDDPEVEPFWAITKYADIVQISKQRQQKESGGPSGGARWGRRSTGGASSAQYESTRAWRIPRGREPALYAAHGARFARTNREDHLRGS
jgi:cytochrome P450